MAFVCATRGSRLALVQARSVVRRLAGAGIATSLEIVSTVGDRVTDRAITAIGTENVFAAEVEQAVRDRRADCAVHSCKDLPSAFAPGITLAAITRREDPRDAFVSERFASFAELPAGSRVGTSSARRRVQLTELRGDLVYDDIRGNVDTRLSKLRDGTYDALVVAMAGLNRLGVRATYTVAFGLDELTPCVGQGALALQMRSDDERVTMVREILGDVATERAVVAERAFLHAMRAGCGAPIGAYAEARPNGALRLVAAVAGADGSGVRRVERTVPVADLAQAELLGHAVAGYLTERSGVFLVGG